MTTAYCYDPLFLEHDLSGHPESRARLERIMEILGDEGLLDRMTLVPPRPVDPGLLTRVHEEPYVALVQRVAGRGGG